MPDTEIEYPSSSHGPGGSYSFLPPGPSFVRRFPRPPACGHDGRGLRGSAAPARPNMAIPNDIKTKAAPEVELTDLSALTPDDRNANKGTQRGTGMLESSLRKYGAGRSILLDKHGRIIAGNKTAEGAASIGMDDVVVVESDGKRLVAVKRTDLDLDDPQTRELAIADNRTGEINLDWNAGEIEALIQDGVDLSELFSGNELGELMGTVPDFEPVSEDEQGRLDQKAPVTCPKCGHEFTP